MAETEGWISLYRRFTEWEWYDSIAVKCLFVHCLLLANYKTKNWKGITIQRGQFITSYEKLAHSNGLTIHQVRTALNKLKMTGEVAVKTTSQYSIITVKNYDLYQDEGTRKVTRMANEGQTDGKQMATTNKDNKDNKGISILEEEEKNNFSEKFLKEYKFWGEYSNVCLSDKQKSKLLGIILNQEALDDLINAFSRNIETKKEDFIDEQHPNLHYERLKSYWDYRRKYPDKFKKELEEVKTNNDKYGNY